MLRNVLADYLARVKEREFDLPFIALLASMGFYDIHFTHANVEFGKDFIAKRAENGTEIQYCFQLKVGNISQSDLRNGVMGQVTELVLTDLSHPNFDRNMPRQYVLVTTGRLQGNAALALQNFNKNLISELSKRPVIFWDRETLLPNLEEYGLNSIYHINTASMTHFGSFYLLYGKALQGSIDLFDIEKHSCYWLNNPDSITTKQKILCSTIESEILATRLSQSGFRYEAIQAILATIRVILHIWWSATNLIDRQFAHNLYQEACNRLQSAVDEYIETFFSTLSQSVNGLATLVTSPAAIIGYQVHCARAVEILGLAYFLNNDLQKRAKTISYLLQFTSKEPGWCHPTSDNYAVSIVLPILALHLSGNTESAIHALKEATIWLCDRYQDGMGLASFGASTEKEVQTLLGYAFDFIELKSSRRSYIATTLADLAAFLGNQGFYTDVVNDIKACEIFPEYWQVKDSMGQFLIEGEDVITYANVNFNDTISTFDDAEYAEHIRHESKSFVISENLGSSALMMLMLLLRDRYFPGVWSKFAISSSS